MSHSKLDQIAKLPEMLKKWRRLALNKAHSFSDASTRTGGGGSVGGGGGSVHTRRSISMPSTRGGDGGSSRGGAGRVPPGHLAVYVGEERRRFVIKMWYLSHPLFRALLKKTEEEIGFQQEGALALPCTVAFFEQMLRIIHSCKAHHHNSITSMLHPHHQEYPIAADEQYEELLLHLLEFSDIPPSPLCNPIDSLSRSFNGASSQAVVA